MSVTGSPPVASTTLAVHSEPWDPDPLFEGETSVVRTVAARREQGRLRAALFGTDPTADMTTRLASLETMPMVTALLSSPEAQLG